MDLVCDGPGPHVPASGVLGTSDRQVRGVRCSAPECVPDVPLSTRNADTLKQRAENALGVNATYLALPSPTNAQTAAQVARLTRQNNILIRLTLGLLESVSDSA